MMKARRNEMACAKAEQECFEGLKKMCKFLDQGNYLLSLVLVSEIS